MSGEGFRRRVALLRDSWAERRQLKRIAGAHDFDSQFRLLELLYGWAETAAADVRAVYEGEVSVSLSQPPLASGPQSFAITVGHGFSGTFALEERQRAGGASWTIAVTVRAVEAVGVAGPERRNGQWTRARLEELVLSLLSAYERAASAVAESPGVGFGPGGAV